MINARFVEETIVNSSDAVVDICSSYEKALAHLALHVQDYSLFLVDVNLKSDQDGIDLMIQFEKFSPRVIFITAYSSPDLLRKAKVLKPLSYIVKPIDESQLKVLIELYLVTDDTSVFSELTNTELKICREISKGNSSVAIADLLSVSRKTIENHRYNICKKLALPPEKNSLLQFVFAHSKELN